MEKNSVILFLMVFVVLFAMVGAFAVTMLSFNHNEHMYIVASFFVSNNQVLYKDFAYLQMPYLPLLYGVIYKLLGLSSYYFFVGKLISFLFLIMSALALFLVTRSATSDIVLSLSIVVLFLLNKAIVYSAAEASNYVMPVAFSMWCFYLFTTSIRSGNVKPWGVVLAGFLLAVAIGTKLTYITVIFPFFIASWLYASKHEYSTTVIKRSMLYILFLFCIGLLVGSLAAISYSLLDPESFIFNNIGYHTINAQWRQITGYTGPMSLLSKITYALMIFFQVDDNLILLILILFGCSRFIGSFQIVRQAIGQASLGVRLAFLLSLIGLLTALVPTPSFYQYYALPVSFLFFLLAYSNVPNVSLVSNTLVLHRKLIVCLVLIYAVYRGPGLFRSIQVLVDRSEWSALHIHDISMNVRNALVNNGIDNESKIATLSPLLVIESNLPIYPELSTGPFLYRIGDLLSAEQRQKFLGVSPETIEDLFLEDPPGAILVGFEDDLDKPLIEYASSHNYKRINVAGFSGDLYIRP